MNSLFLIQSLKREGYDLDNEVIPIIKDISCSVASCRGLEMIFTVNNNYTHDVKFAMSSDITW